MWYFMVWFVASVVLLWLRLAQRDHDKLYGPKTFIDHPEVNDK